MNNNDDATRAADAADQWLRSGTPQEQPSTDQAAAFAWTIQRRNARQHTTFSLLSRIDDLKAEVRMERERADRLEIDLVLAQTALTLTRREETLKLRDRAGLAIFGFLVFVGVWANLWVITQ